jgi:hypothetical protein
MDAIAITLTTINLPTVLEHFIALQQKYPHADTTVDFIIAGDRKTPAGTEAYLDSLRSRTRSQIIYLDLPQQERHFAKYSGIWNHIPLDSFARRNYADLLAYQRGYSLIIRIDDDNLPTDDDFIGGHSVAGQRLRMPTIESETGWFNVCESLDEEHGVAFYPRGYPYERRWEPAPVAVSERDNRIVVNAGLWLGDPDVDAITRLCRSVNATRYREEAFGRHFALAPGTWCPINTQNTAFVRETIPAAFVSPHAERYDDIFSGYFLRAIIDHVGDAVSYGRPLLNQVRNYHDLWKDLRKETVGGQTTVAVTDELRSLTFSRGDYLGCYGELIAALKENLRVEREHFLRIFEGMHLWYRLFESL